MGNKNKIQKKEIKKKIISLCLITLGFWTIIFSMAYLVDGWEGFPKVFLGIPAIILSIWIIINNN